MAGIVMQIVPKRTLDFNNLANLTTEDIVLAQGIDVSQWREVSLMIRVHATTLTTVGTITLFAQTEGRTAEDPGVLFFDSTLRGSQVLSNAQAVGFYTVNTVGTNLGSMIRVVARGNRTTVGTTNMTVDVSVDLSLKSA